MLWYTRPQRQPQQRTEAFLQAQQRLSTVHCVEDLFCCLTHIAPASSLQRGASYRLFKDGVGVSWEAEGNREGGRIVLEGCADVDQLWVLLVAGCLGGELTQAMIIVDDNDEKESNEQEREEGSSSDDNACSSNTDDVEEKAKLAVNGVVVTMKKGGGRAELWLNQQPRSEVTNRAIAVQLKDPPSLLTARVCVCTRNDCAQGSENGWASTRWPWIRRATGLTRSQQILDSSSDRVNTLMSSKTRTIDISTASKERSNHFPSPTASFEASADPSTSPVAFRPTNSNFRISI